MPQLPSLAHAPHPAREAVLAALSDRERDHVGRMWELWARPEQLPPPGNWRLWLISAGRGFGKTRAGAEWVRRTAEQNPDARIALVGASLAEVRAVMVEGESGVLSVSHPDFQPEYEPSLRRITWSNGAQAFLYSAAEPESLRGPQHSHAWCDEIAKWDASGIRSMRVWDNLLLGMRAGEEARIVATTTPRPVPLLQRLMAEGDEGDEVVITQGATHDNAANLPTAFLRTVRAQFCGSSFARQELGGELVTDTEGALWSRDLLERCRAANKDDMRRIVVGVDPPASAHGDECGIVVAGLTAQGNAVVLADCTIARASPERWARAVAEAAKAWGADRVVAEANQGGQMVGSVLRAADITLPVRLVHASRSKLARAEPVAALYEAGRVRHGEHFPELEDQLCALMPGGHYEGPTRSPDRADALVWALSELMLKPPAEPRIRLLW